MSDDIVARLSRYLATDFPNDADLEPGATIAAAIAEIERLRADLAELRKAVDDGNTEADFEF